MYVVVDRATQVPKDALDERKVGLRRVMHEQADLLNRVRQVEAGQSEVLESSDEASVLDGVGNRGTRQS